MHSVPLDLLATPFSTADSFLTLSAVGPRLVYRTASSRAHSLKDMPFWSHDFFQLAAVRNGAEVPYRWQAWADRVELVVGSSGVITITFADPKTLVFCGRGVGLHLLPCKPFATATMLEPGRAAIYDHPGRGMHHFRAGEGTALRLAHTRTVHGVEKVYADLPWRVEFNGKAEVSGALRFEETLTQWDEPLADADHAAQKLRHAIGQWLRKTPEVDERFAGAAAHAWLLPWLNLVPASGNLTRRTIYCSKQWMNATWAWDNCFHSLEIAEADPEMAWDQLRLFCDHQSPDGQVPDAINDLESRIGFLKPPIYGWTALRLVELAGLDAGMAALKELYEPIRLQTEWWFRFRDPDGNGFCEYHHGNDSGWDNATVFDQGYPTEGADLAAHLALQTEALGRIAGWLGKRAEARRLQEDAARQVARLVKMRAKGGRFISPLRGKRSAAPCMSLLNIIPVQLGARLPNAVLKKLVADLSPGGPFLTRFGLATEAPASPKYEPDGYWRGPIWGPSTYLIFDGLVDAGETRLARTIARRYCDLCLHSPGFWENYDALTGRGLRCPAYSWTAAVFLLLARWLHHHPGDVFPPHGSGGGKRGRTGLAPAGDPSPPVLGSRPSDAPSGAADARCVCAGSLA